MRHYVPTDLGFRVYQALAGRKSPNTEPSSFRDALGWFVKAAGGNVSAAARLAGVPRRSMRDWLAGTSTPGAERRQGIADAARLSERRARLTPGRESRLRGRSAEGIVLVGRYNYDFLDDPSGEMRDVQVGRYMDDNAIDRLMDAYLGGASPEDLRLLFAGMINDPADFYNRTMALPPSDDHGWTVRSVNL